VGIANSTRDENIIGCFNDNESSENVVYRQRRNYATAANVRQSKEPRGPTLDNDTLSRSSPLPIRLENKNEGSMRSLKRKAMTEIAVRSIKRRMLRKRSLKKREEDADEKNYDHGHHNHISFKETVWQWIIVNVDGSEDERKLKSQTIAELPPIKLRLEDGMMPENEGNGKDGVRWGLACEAIAVAKVSLAALLDARVV
jgi:hypothetical protein